MNRKPNFFILGAPKCGTTSLAAWLSEHPQVFMTYPKELDYFDHDRRKGFSDSLERYERYFVNVQPRHKAIGEASTGYLRSGVAVSGILKYAPEARFIVGLRNPVDMAISWHGQALFEGWEDKRDFATAWRLQQPRSEGRQIPSGCPDGSNLLYGEVCRLGRQLDRLYSQVPRERIFCYTVDELRADPSEVYERLLAFLEVVPSRRTDFPVLNEARAVPRWLSLLSRVVWDVQRRVGMYKGLGITSSLNRRLADRKKAEVGDDLRGELQSYFCEEICLIEQLLGRDLSNWKASEPPTAAVSEPSAREA